MDNLPSSHFSVVLRVPKTRVTGTHSTTKSQCYNIICKYSQQLYYLAPPTVTACRSVYFLGMGRVQTRPEARPEGVLGDPDPSRAIFGGPEVDPRQFFLARAIFFFLKC